MTTLPKQSGFLVTNNENAQRAAVLDDAPDEETEDRASWGHTLKW
jgi:hypothetical protein